MSLNNSGGIAASSLSPDYPTGTQTHATAITSQDGTVTINIRQPDHHKKSGGHSSSSHTGKSSSQTPSRSGKESQTRPAKTVREVFYSSDPNEEFVDSERVSVFVDKDDLQKQYERAVYHGRCSVDSCFCIFIKTEVCLKFMKSLFVTACSISIFLK